MYSIYPVAFYLRSHMQPKVDFQSPQSDAPNCAIFELTPREWEVLLYVGDDLTNAEIADLLCLTAKSVVNYRNRIGCKLDLKGARKLARFVRTHQQELRQWHELLVSKLPPQYLVT